MVESPVDGLIGLCVATGIAPRHLSDGIVTFSALDLNDLHEQGFQILALPQNLWVKGSNISRLEAFGFFAFPR
jgi:hypothetical protein